MGADIDDVYYALEFFIISEFDGLPSNFLYPVHFDSVESAKIAADYWINTGVFNAVKCKMIEESCLKTVFKVLDTPFFIRKDGNGGYYGKV